jgi:hypothetical protein
VAEALNSLAAVVKYGATAMYPRWPRPKQWGDILVTPYAAVRASGHRFRADPLEPKGVRRLREWARTARKRRIAVKFEAVSAPHPTYPERQWHQSNIKRRWARRRARLGLAAPHYQWLLDHEHTAVRLTSNDPYGGLVFVVFNVKTPIAWLAPLVAYDD